MSDDWRTTCLIEPAANGKWNVLSPDRKWWLSSTHKAWWFRCNAYTDNGVGLWPSKAAAFEWLANADQYPMHEETKELEKQ